MYLKYMPLFWILQNYLATLIELTLIWGQTMFQTFLQTENKCWNILTSEFESTFIKKRDSPVAE